MFVFFIIVVLLVPAAMTGIGLLWARRPPAKVNMLYGYRTPRSMKSSDAWKFAHGYISALWKIIGIPAGLISAFLLYIFKSDNPDTTGTIAIAVTAGQIAVLCLTVVLTEIKLGKKFNQKGKAKKR